jgi:hypothetical protein
MVGQGSGPVNLSIDDKMKYTRDIPTVAQNFVLICVISGPLLIPLARGRLAKTKFCFAVVSVLNSHDLVKRFLRVSQRDNKKSLIFAFPKEMVGWPSG